MFNPFVIANLIICCRLPWIFLSLTKIKANNNLQVFCFQKPRPIILCLYLPCIIVFHYKFFPNAISTVVDLQLFGGYSFSNDWENIYNSRYFQVTNYFGVSCTQILRYLLDILQLLGAKILVYPPQSGHPIQWLMFKYITWVLRPILLWGF